MSMADNLIFFVGLSDVAMAVLMTYAPELLYESAFSHWINRTTGYVIAKPHEEPVFSHGLASVVAAIGIGHIVASRSGAGGRFTIFAMNAAAAILTIASLVSHKEDGVACTMTFTMGIVETVFTIALYYLGAAQGITPATKEKEE